MTFEWPSESAVRLNAKIENKMSVFLTQHKADQLLRTLCHVRLLHYWLVALSVLWCLNSSHGNDDHICRLVFRDVQRHLGTQREGNEPQPTTSCSQAIKGPSSRSTQGVDYETCLEDTAYPLVLEPTLKPLINMRRKVLVIVKHPLASA